MSPQAVHEHIDAFRNAMRAEGVPYNGPIEGDGKLRRIYVEGDRKGTRNGWFILHLDEKPAGAFGTKKGDLKSTWSAKGVKPLTREEREALAERQREDRARRAAAEAARQAKSAALANQIWDSALDATEHPYLTRKGVKPFGLRVGTWVKERQDGSTYVAAKNALLIPIRDSRKAIVGLQAVFAQAIDGGRDKDFVYGARKAGCWATIGAPTEIDGQLTIGICEGYATGASVHMATNMAVVVAFDSGNLKPVAETVRRLIPAARIVVLGDNDLWTRINGQPVNVGVNKATEAAAAVDGLVAVPHFDDLETAPSDWNDLHAIAGLAEVGRQVLAVIRPPDLEPPKEASSASPTADIQVEDFLAYMPDHRYIFLPSGDAWPAASVNARIAQLPLLDENGMQVLGERGAPKFIAASAWLDKNRPVEQMTWAPGEPQLIGGRLIKEGGWIDRPGATVFNQYRPPAIVPGDPRLASRWIEHVRRVYPENEQHIMWWMAHRVQRPGEKINHSLVLGGNMGVGKDTLLEPLKRAVGPWNFTDIEANQVMGRFNGFAKSVVLRISEARDHGDVDRYAFYDRTKTLMAAPPDVLRVDEKHVREYSVMNVVGVVITTNHKAGGIYLPPDDRRHYVAWSELARADFEDTYWTELWAWYEAGGLRHVAAYLGELDLSAFNPKAPPPKTDAFWAIVNSSRSSAAAEFDDALDGLGRPGAVTIAMVASSADDGLREWLKDRKNGRAIPHRFEECGYDAVRNPAAKDGLWKVGGKRAAIYAQRELTPSQRLDAAARL